MAFGFWMLRPKTLLFCSKMLRYGMASKIQTFCPDFAKNRTKACTNFRFQYSDPNYIMGIVRLKGRGGSIKKFGMHDLWF